jgi:hypothetical protein
LRASDVLPDGRAAVDFQTSKNSTVSQPTTFNPNGTVTFPSTPVFANLAVGSLILLRRRASTAVSAA